MEKPSLKYLQKEHFGKVEDYHSEVLQNVSRTHIKSFNFLLKKGLMNAVNNIHPIEIQLPNEDHLKIVFQKAAFQDLRENQNANETQETKDKRIVFPSECRLRRLSYTSTLNVQFACSINGELFYEGQKSFSLPIMVKSDVCALNLLNPKEHIYHGEEEEEWGGYFIVNGVERIIRMLIIPRRNYPMALQCPKWKMKQRDHYTSNEIYIRCVKNDQTSHEVRLHFLTDGSVEIEFAYGNRLYFLPLMFVLRALSDCPDSFLYEELSKGSIEKNFKRSILNMIRKMQDENLYTKIEAKRFIGQKFRVIVGLPSWYHDEDIADFLLKECILVHLMSDICKLNLLIFMTRKLFDLVKNKCALESCDNPMHQEVLLGGHLYLIILKQELQKLIKSVKRNFEKKIKGKGKHFTLTKSILESCFRYSYNITIPVKTMLSTGTANIGNGLNKATGLTVVADKKNFIRQISHFTAIEKHSILKLTAMRKFFPEAWGFLCPIHTPDGIETGLINHVTSSVEILTEELSNECLLNILTKLGMFPFFAPTPFEVSSCYTVITDGRILGYVPKNSALKFVNNLRYLKSMNFEEKIFKYLEIVFAPVTEKLSQYPGIYIFSTPGRMMRQVLNLRSYQTELIGTMEQVYLNICVNPCEFYEKITTHQELEKTNFLSITANMIPFSDYNYSPKNIFGCQMNKQAMGISCHALKYRSDTTLYQLQYPQSPMVRTSYYDYYQMDNYPVGTNAIVAVISYSGFDMEDAIVLNKASVQRGFTNGNIFKSKYVDLQEISKSKKQSKMYFGRKPTDQNLQDFLDIDGLPYIGIMMKEGDPICSYIDSTGETSIVKYHLKESAYVHDVKVMNNERCSNMLKKILITFRIPRFPENGDKFSNRHGQKGICGTLLSIEDMPFTSEGIVPDILFNPHGFPSRMTIGMMIEVMAGKSTALLAKLDDASPFEFSEEQSFKYSKERSAVDYFGKLLEEAGYDYYSTEKMYSGFSGKELEADVFCGIVYYQRLCHMVADKFQVRSKGKKYSITQQPVQGRQWGGGIRFGEMERDALIASGASALINDRFMKCSDKCRAYVCTHCEELIYPIVNETMKLRNSVAMKCRNCDDHSAIIAVYIPYVFCYLTAELAALNIKVKLVQKEN